MHRDLCGGEKPGLCEAMVPIDGELLKDYLLKVNFTGTRLSILTSKFSVVLAYKLVEFCYIYMYLPGVNVASFTRFPNKINIICPILPNKQLKIAITCSC